MDGKTKTQAASRHIGDPQGAQGKVNRACFLAAPSGRYVTNSYANLDGAARHSLEPVFKVLQHFQLTSVM